MSLPEIVMLLVAYTCSSGGSSGGSYCSYGICGSGTGLLVQESHMEEPAAEPIYITSPW